jgi:hypothetical protein
MKYEVWVFKEDTPQDILDKVKEKLDPYTLRYFDTTYTCIVTKELSSLSDKISTYLDSEAIKQAQKIVDDTKKRLGIS